MTNRADQIFRLLDGRTLGFAEYGDPADQPVFFFPSLAGTRLEHPTEDGLLERCGVRLIVTDRPGLSLSGYLVNHQLLDWPADIDQLAAHLDIHDLYVLDHSAGGAHALACAYTMPERVRAGSLPASQAPANRPKARKGLPVPNQLLMLVPRHLPFLVAPIRRLMPTR